MIWLIRFLYLFVGAVFGFVICGLLTSYKDDRIQRLQKLIVMLLDRIAKKDKIELLKLIDQELDEGINPRRPITH